MTGCLFFLRIHKEQGGVTALQSLGPMSLQRKKRRVKDQRWKDGKSDSRKGICMIPAILLGLMHRECTSATSMTLPQGMPRLQGSERIKHHGQAIGKVRKEHQVLWSYGN